MVATDVAARGIDVSGVELVVQVEPPEDSKSFLHRSGRTARAGKSGDVVTIVLPNQRRRTRRLLHEAGLKIKPIEVTHDSPEVLELVGEVAEPVFGWTLEQSQPTGNPRRKRSGRDNAERGDRFGRSNRSGGRNKDRGKDKGGKPFKSERSDRNERSERHSDTYEERFKPARNRAERRAEKFRGRDNREALAREERWENPEVQETHRDEHERKRNDKRREKYAPRRTNRSNSAVAGLPAKRPSSPVSSLISGRALLPRNSAKPTRESSAVSQTTVKAAATGVPIAMDTMTDNKAAESASTARRFA